MKKIFSLCWAVGLTPVYADRDHVPIAPAVYVQECGSCHLAFGAHLLPKASWSRILQSLEQHYGSDASLDAVTQKKINDWLQAQGGQGKRAREVPADDRITRAAWFERKHRSVSVTAFRRASIKSPVNCVACHPDAAKGDFEDDAVRIPK